MIPIIGTLGAVIAVVLMAGGCNADDGSIGGGCMALLGTLTALAVIVGAMALVGGAN